MESVLIVDDNDHIREMLHPMIGFWLEDNHLSPEIHEASNGIAAISWVESHGVPDLLLLDVRMPQMNGAEFLRHMASLGHDIRRQTLILTGFADDLEAHLGTDALLMQHLRKPFTPQELFQALDQMMKQLPQ